MKKMMIAGIALFLLISTACSHESNAKTPSQIDKANNKRIEYAQGDFTYEAIPETFTLTVTKDGTTETIAEPQKKRKVTNLKKTATETSWDYPDDKFHVSIKKQAKSLNVKIHSTNPKTSQLEWPRVNAPTYTLPISEGKQIPQHDAAWKKYFTTDNEQTMNEYFSMKFFTLNKEKFAVSYILPDTFNNDISFHTDPAIQFSINHTFSSVNKEKVYKYSIFITENDPVAIAKNYQNYIKDHHQFTTLAEKEKQNPEIKKLYGAPHAYLWNSRILTSADMHWNKLQTSIEDPLFDWMGNLLDRYGEDGATEYRKVLTNIKNGEMYQYEKNMILNSLQYILQMPQLYSPTIFKNPDATAKKYIDKGIAKLNEQELYDLNKHLIASHIKDLTTPVREWGQSNSTAIIQEMKQAGIKNAWIGLPNWVNGLMNPTAVNTAAGAGYLVGPYDSYQSIQQNASIDWNTASFPDPKLYEDATVENEQGEKLTGFLGKGRKLNPTLVFNAVKTRVNGILAEGIAFNSWFMDVDAAGELHEDFAKSHPTTQKEDAAARMKRLDYLNKKGFVIGSEGGNDYAASHIAFAHGLETPVIKWGDPDMREKEDSPYFIGKYASMDGSIPTRYSKIVPIKEGYKPIYTSPVYSIPLFKLVYNRSVITTHHWEWDSYKIKEQTGERRLKEYLYNTPPLFHLDEANWELHRADITANMKNWTPFQQEALRHEMTNFQILDAERLVQKTEFGSTLQVIANFSTKDFKTDHGNIQAHTALIINNGKKTMISTNNLD